MLAIAGGVNLSVHPPEQISRAVAGPDAVGEQWPLQELWRRRRWLMCLVKGSAPCC